MKRILKAGIVGLSVSMLFTGCGSSAFVNGLVGDYEEIAWEVIEDDPERSKWGEAGLAEGETLAPYVAPDYYVSNDQDREEILKSQDGIAAFKMKEGHSQHSQDIESFDVVDMLDDGTFVYYYSTRIGERPEKYDENTDNRKIVHCVAKYNYKTQAFKILLESAFTRTTVDIDEENEAFYVQMCESDGSGDLFVYDRGTGYIFNSTDEIEFQTEIGTFIRKHFKGASVIATEAMTDGDNRIYVNVTIEKEEILISEEDDNEDISEEDADKEAEELDKKVDEQTIEVVLVYDFKAYDEIGIAGKSRTLDQAKTNFDAQVSYWQNMRNIPAGYLNWEPPAEDDWTSTLSSVPSQWGIVYLYALEDWTENDSSEPSGMPVLQWTGEKSFLNVGGYVPSFIPDPGQYQFFTDLKADSKLNNVFTFIDGHYYELYGSIGNDLGEGDYDYTFFSRNVKRVDDIKNEDGSTSRTDSTITQTLSKGRKRDIYPTDCYFEGYWISPDFNSVLDVIDGDLFCLIDNGIYWLKEDGTYHRMLDIGAEDIASIFKQDGILYIAVSSEGYTAIYQYNNEKNYTDLHLISSDQVMNVVKEVEYRHSSVDDKYHSKYDEWTKDETNKPADANAGELLDGENLLFVTLSDPQTELLTKLETNENVEIPNTGSVIGFVNSGNLSSASGKGYLITSMTHGLVYLDSASGKSICLDDGSWYGAWKTGDSYVAVGFPDIEKKDTSTEYASKKIDDNVVFGAMDMAHAKVLEFEIDDLYKNGIEKILKSVSPEVLEPEEEEGEGAKQMKEQYEQITETKEVPFVDPNYQEWENIEPGSLYKKKEEERQKAKEESQKAKEEIKY